MIKNWIRMLRVKRKYLGLLFKIIIINYEKKILKESNILLTVVFWQNLFYFVFVLIINSII